MGALSVFANTEVLDVEVEDGKIKGVKTTRGDIETEYLVIACVVYWSPRVGEMAGAAIPLVPLVIR